jgi:hypothetical protein
MTEGGLILQATDLFMGRYCCYGRGVRIVGKGGMVGGKKKGGGIAMDWKSCHGRKDGCGLIVLSRKEEWIELILLSREEDCCEAYSVI